MLTHSRRGHIPTMLLLVEGLVLMLVVWAVFLSGNGDLDALDRTFITLTSELNERSSYYGALVPLMVDRTLNDLEGNSGDFSSLFRERFNQRAAIVDSFEKRETNLFGKIRLNDYTLEQDDSGIYILTIEGVFANVELEGHKLTRTFDIVVRFSSDGSVVA